MKFVSSKEEAVAKLLSTFKEFNNSRMIGDNSGWCNYALVVDDKYIFRFPKNEKALNSVKNECNVLESLKKVLPESIKVPDYIFKDLSNDYPFVGYVMIKGKFLSKAIYDKFDDSNKELITDLISLFLRTLHKIDYRKLGLVENNNITEFEPLYNEIKKVCYQYFSESAKKKTEELFNGYFTDPQMSEYKPCLIHGDLSLDHIILTESGIGIIDFGDARVFDPAYDYIWAAYFGDDFINKLMKKNGLDHSYLYRIDNFYKKRTPYYGVVYSIKMDNDEEFQNSMQYLYDTLGID